MFSSCKYLFLCVIPVLYYSKSCVSEPVFPPSLVLYSPGDPEYTDVIVKREHDNLTLVCELRGDQTLRSYVWNHVSNNTQRPYSVEPLGASASSKLTKADLQLADSGQYMCSAPPFSVTKYILVQTKGPSQCARGAFWCGARCVLAAYVCDGRRDCAHGEDEAPDLCTDNICSRSDKLNCSSGRCISASACCRGAAPLCRQPACCDEFPLTRQLGYVDEYPPLFEDRHAPDDYGFIQSTIYTVTACALIFMIAVVLLVSAICKMHMKRAALRGYAHADRATRHHYSVQYAQAHRFPPCYEASRLLEENRTGSPQQSPVHAPATPPEIQCAESPGEPRGLARLSSIFSSRYRQVPTQPEPVEMTAMSRGVGAGPAPSYRSPACCALDAELLFAEPAPAEAAGRELNYMAAPLELVRRRARRHTLERVMHQLDRQPLTLQLGRFQLSIPGWGRADPRPDTPTVAELDIERLDFVRLHRHAAADTYTLNGRTIRLLGADFQDYPPPAPAHLAPPSPAGPPPYTEAVGYKLYGPPPDYLSREALDTRSGDTADREATANVEMPPCYEDLNANHFNDTGEESRLDAAAAPRGAPAAAPCGAPAAAPRGAPAAGPAHAGDGVGAVERVSMIGSAGRRDTIRDTDNEVDVENNDSVVETLSSIIDNLPAIDSDVNANETDRAVATSGAGAGAGAGTGAGAGAGAGTGAGAGAGHRDNVANNNVICD